MKLLPLFRAVVVLLVMGIANRAAATIDIFETQPGDRSSGIVLQGFTWIDEGLASMIADTIVDEDDNPRVKNATFLFQQCFGGGFLDNLRDVLPTNDPRMSFVGASASSHDEVAFGLKSRREIMAEGRTPSPSYPNGPCPASGRGTWHRRWPIPPRACTTLLERRSSRIRLALSAAISSKKMGNGLPLTATRFPCAIPMRSPSTLY